LLADDGILILARKLVNFLLSLIARIFQKRPGKILVWSQMRPNLESIFGSLGHIKA